MSQIENYTATWIETPLSKFGFKCVMNKHNFCVDSCLKELQSLLMMILIKNLDVTKQKLFDKNKHHVVIPE